MPRIVGNKGVWDSDTYGSLIQQIKDTKEYKNLSNANDKVDYLMKELYQQYQDIRYPTKN
jgi:hypothetical protein